jgi:hypothetical protein
VLLSLLCAFSMWFYVQRILIPHEQFEAALHASPRGNLSDLYPRWLGARELLLHHRNPYSAEVTREIQSGYYGRPLNPSRMDEPHDEQRFAYPIYVVFFLAPTISLPFPIVSIIFRCLLILLTPISVLLWLRAMRWKPSSGLLLSVLLLTLGSFPAIQGLKLQQLSLLGSFLLAAAAAALVAGHLYAAGILIAIATIKPQLVFLLIPWLLLWTISGWPPRQRLLWAFSAAMLLLLVGSELLLPGWIPQFRAAISEYYRYTAGGRSLLDVLVGTLAGKLLSAALLVILVGYALRTRRAASSQSLFFETLAATLTITLVIMPTFAPYNQLLLLPAILILIRDRHMFARFTSRLKLTAMLLIAIIAWPWIASTGLLLASIVSPATNFQNSWAFPLYTSLAIPPAVLILLFLRLRHLDRDEQVPPARLTN